MQTIGFEFKADSISDVGIFEGYAATYDLDRQYDVIERGAFAETISKGVDWPILWQHQRQEPIGVNLAAAEDSRGLAIKGQLNLEVQRGREAFSLMKQGALKALSIGFSIGQNDAKFDESGKIPVRRISKLQMFEYSPVTFPANERALIQRIKANEEVTEREFEEFLRDAGFSRTKAKAIVSRGYRGIQREADDSSVMATLAAAIAIESARLRLTQ